MNPLYAHQFSTPLGNALLVVNAMGALRLLTFTDDAEAAAQTVVRPGETLVWETNADAPLIAPVVLQLNEYFAGTRQTFTVPLDFSAGSAFQQTVWAELCRVPHGQTISYGELARRIGKSPTAAARAVGRANATNPIAVVVPCHRVIGANGTLTGYAYGTDRKAHLLRLEGAILPGLL